MMQLFFVAAKLRFVVKEYSIKFDVLLIDMDSKCPYFSTISMACSKSWVTSSFPLNMDARLIIELTS